MWALPLLYSALMLLSGVASLSGNMLQLMLLLLHRELRSDTLSLTLSCCFSDIALGLSAFPFAIYHGLTPPSGPPSEGVLCQGGGFLLLLLQTSSLHSLAWASVDKFLEICLALSYGSLVTAARCRAVLLLLWSVCLGGAVLPLLGFGCYAYSEASFLCGPSFSPAHRAFVLLWVGGGLAPPLLAMVSLYGLVVCVARRQARRGTFICNELHCYYVPANVYLRSSIAMLSTSVCVLVCWLPYISVCVYETFSGHQSPSVVSALSTWLVLSSTALNPWITCLTQR
ncbi:LOW QUALITY PROTEIN: adenosine receptor A2b [Eleginops maclovinus]|uniref:LOW QUALITY PROTEIN: adenosine receptor A2b n=1 Tax=Eleginops maclovinus TaxID=56733 RepID=UPI0030804206